MVFPVTCSMARHDDLDAPRAKGHCWRCDAELPKYRRKWCSDDCALLYARNHSWGFARFAALKRDNHTCQRCGIKVIDSHTYPDKSVWAEVNHIDPRCGMGYGPGCHNHQENLETLCHPCHLKTTKKQNSARRLAQRRRLDTAPSGILIAAPVE